MTAASKHGLGRGLAALIPSKPVDSSGLAGLRHVQLAHIEPNPQQPRKHFPAGALDELAASIREHGLLQPLLLTEIHSAYGSRYQLIAGERRWRAAQLAGLATVPAVVKGVNAQQMLELALVENVQRADLNPLEEAEAFRHLMQEFQLTQEQVAARVGKDRTTVANALRLLRMPDALKAAVLNELITEGHARALMQVTNPGQLADLIQHVTTGHLSVRQTEELVRRATTKEQVAAETAGRRAEARNAIPASRGEHERAPAVDVATIEQELRRALGTKVEVHCSQRGGKIVIEFYSDEELDALYTRLIH